MTGTPEKTPAQPPSVAKTPYGIVMEALEEILELDVDEGSFDDARAIASLAHSRAIAHWSRPAEPKPLRELAAAVAESDTIGRLSSQLAEAATVIDDYRAEVARLSATPEQRELDSLREKLNDAEREAVEIHALAVAAFGIITVLARGNPAAQRQANELRKQIGMLPSPPEADLAEPQPAPELAALQPYREDT